MPGVRRAQFPRQACVLQVQSDEAWVSNGAGGTGCGAGDEVFSDAMVGSGATDGNETLGISRWRLDLSFMPRPQLREQDRLFQMPPSQTRAPR